MAGDGKEQTVWALEKAGKSDKIGAYLMERWWFVA